MELRTLPNELLVFPMCLYFPQDKGAAKNILLEASPNM